nr:transglutaminase domain-containing protein [Parabacteroides goldsteinii]
MKTITTILIIILYTACSSFNEEQMQYTMKLAGKNKAELEKVLRHYKNDSLKLEAAKFLIRNMYHCYSYQQGGIMDSIKNVRSRANSYGQVEKKYIYQWSGYSYKELPKIFDAQIITSKYLIKNIDQAFDNWKKRRWNHYLSFDEFCEYLLPYRIGNEPLQEWRDLYHNEYAFLLDSIYKGSDVIKAANLLSEYLSKPTFIFNEDFNLPHLGAQYLFNHRYGTCVDAADIFLYACRAIGIPCSIETDARGSHMWNAVKDTTDKSIIFWQFNYIAKRGYTQDLSGHNKGKVYRIMFDIQKDRLAYISKKQKEMPPFFQTPFLKDVSESYYPDSLLLETKELTDISNGDFIYLGFFYNKKWWGCTIGEITGDCVNFKNIESDQVYAPLIYKNGNYIQCGYPFLFKENEKHTFIPNRNNYQKIKLYRKYPIYEWMLGRINYIVGATIEGSNTADFKHPKTLYNITKAPTVAYNAINFKEPIKYRYIRYRADKNKIIEIAEINFSYKGEPITPLSVFGSESQIGNQEAVRENVSDNNPLTYYLSQDKGGSVIFDLGTNYIDKIVYMPHNDDNFIRKGDCYELFYNDGKDGWKSLGKQIADTTYLEYCIPNNILMLLRDYTRGREEQIFYIKDGKQIFPTY